MAIPLQCHCWSACLWRLKAYDGNGGLCLGPSLCGFVWKPVQWKALGQLAFKNSCIVSVIFLLPNKCVCKWCPMTSQNPVQLHSECSHVAWVDKHLASHLNASCSNVVLQLSPAVILFCHLSSVLLKEACFSGWTSIPFLHLQLKAKKVQDNSTRPAWRHEVWRWGKGTKYGG